MESIDEGRLSSSENGRWNRKWKSVVLGLILLVIISVAVRLFVRTFIFQAFKMTSKSMLPTLLPGDCIIVNKFPRAIRVIKRGDVIVFQYPRDSSKDWLKRVIAAEGDVVRGENRKIFLNDKILLEPYVVYTENEPMESMDKFGPVSVAPGKVFVMGDNRDNSLDSRQFGLVDVQAVKGKALYIYWSSDLSRIGTKIK